MRKRYKVVLFFVVLLLSISTVLALWWIPMKAWEVESCFDYDYGLNPWTGSNVTGYNLDQTYYSHLDYCKDNVTLVEYSCEWLGKRRMVAPYKLDCSIENVSCSNAKCVN